MTDLSSFLEDFGGPVEAVQTETGPVVGYAEVESQKLEAFETGYKAGWDDAVAAHDEDTGRITADLAQNLQDLSFTYHEAYNQVLRSMNPLLDEIVSVLLPGLLQDAMGQQLLKQLQTLAEEIGMVQVSIAVTSDVLPKVEPLLKGEFSFPIDVQGDPTLDAARAEIRFGDVAKQIDLNEILQTVKDSVQGFIHETQRTASNG